MKFVDYLYTWNMRRSVQQRTFLECMCLKEGHYFKTAAFINCKTVQNSEGTVNEKKRRNQFSD